VAKNAEQSRARPGAGDSAEDYTMSPHFLECQLLPTDRQAGNQAISLCFRLRLTANPQNLK